MLVFDIETDGLLDELTRVHCLSILDTATGELARYNHVNARPVEEGVRRLSESDGVIGHNIISFDLSALSKVYPWFKAPRVDMDTLVAARVIFTDVSDQDHDGLRKNKLPAEFAKGKLVGKHKLAAWGYRLGVMKGDFTGPWEVWTQEMDDYCEQDVRVTYALWKLLAGKKYSPECLELEHAVEFIIHRQQRYGVGFNVAAAEKLTAYLMGRRAELEESCKTVFSPWLVRDGKPFIPKKDNAKYGYCAGAIVQKLKWQIFNPGSRDQIADRLIKLYGWEPTEFTDSGKPKVDETTMDGLTFPRVKELVEYLLVDKRLGQLAEGKQALLKAVRADSRIHGSINANGAVTGRMTHFSPNVNVPKVGTPYGAEFRDLFMALKGLMVGCDAEGLEMRALGHFMARYDGGAYVNAVVNGKKEDGTDAHSVNRNALLFRSRDKAKTWFYAFVFGAGNYKLGTIVLDDFDDEKRARFFAKYPPGDERRKAIARIGRVSRDRISSGIPALGKLIKVIQSAVKQRGRLVGLDGRYLRVRSSHAAPNTLFQSAGAVVMKRALVILDKNLQDAGLIPGVNYEFVLNVHDEWQIEVITEEHAEFIGQTAAEAIKLAGEHYSLRCPLAGDYRIGKTWKETH